MKTKNPCYTWWWTTPVPMTARCVATSSISLDCLIQKEYNYGNEEKNGKDSISSRYDGYCQWRWSMWFSSRQHAKGYFVKKRIKEMQIMQALQVLPRKSKAYADCLRKLWKEETLKTTEIRDKIRIRRRIGFNKFEVEIIHRNKLYRCQSNNSMAWDRILEKDDINDNQVSGTYTLKGAFQAFYDECKLKNDLK